MYLLLLIWCRSVNIMIALYTAVKKTRHQLQAWGSVFSFAHFIYLSNPIDIRESHTCKSKSDLACCVLGELWKLFELLCSSGVFNVLHYSTVMFLSKHLGYCVDLFWRLVAQRKGTLRYKVWEKHRGKNVGVVVTFSLTKYIDVISLFMTPLSYSKLRITDLDSSSETGLL